MGLTLKIKLFSENQISSNSTQTRDDRPLSVGYRFKGDSGTVSGGQPEASRLDIQSELGSVLRKLRALAIQTPTEEKKTNTYKGLLAELDALVQERQQDADPRRNAPSYIKFNDFISNELTNSINIENKNIRINIRREAGDDEPAAVTKDPLGREKVINLATHAAARRNPQEIRQTRPTGHGQESPIHAHTAASMQKLMTKHLQQMQIQSQNYASCAMQNTVNIASQLAELAERFTQWHSQHAPMPKDITLSLLR